MQVPRAQAVQASAPHGLKAEHSLCLCPNLFTPENFQDPGCFVGRCLVSRRVLRGRGTQTEPTHRVAAQSAFLQGRIALRLLSGPRCSLPEEVAIPACFLPGSLRLSKTVVLLGLWNIENGDEKMRQPVLALPGGSVCPQGPQQGSPSPRPLVGT